MKKKFAIPVCSGAMDYHFGHCEQFVIIETVDGLITAEKSMDPPPHRQGSHPKFLAEMGVDVVITGGMGRKALDILEKKGIEVCLGNSDGLPADLVRNFLAGDLMKGSNLCDH